MSSNDRASLWVARIIPVVLIGIASYSSWVFIAQLCVDHLLNASEAGRARPGVAIGLLIPFIILLLLVASTYFRLLYCVNFKPDFVPRSARYLATKKEELGGRSRSKSRRRRRAISSTQTGDVTKSFPGESGQQQEERGGSFALPYGVNEAKPDSDSQDLPEMQEYIKRDLFVSDAEGRPVYCTRCLSYKPERTHHCREVDRCVERMDHFCPWVGGVVSRRSYRYFSQFIFYCGVWCLYILIPISIFLREINQLGQVNVHWIVVAVLSGIFGLFTIGLTGSTLQFIFLNVTTIENLSRKAKVWTLSIYIEPAILETLPPDPPFRMVTYADPSASSTTSPVYPLPSRSFAVLYTRIGENPFDLGSPYKNFTSIMGRNILECCLPIARRSPNINPSGLKSIYPTGPVVERMRREAGILPQRQPYLQDLTRPRKRHRKRSRSQLGRRAKTVRAESADRTPDAAPELRAPMGTIVQEPEVELQNDEHGD